ncbi:helix-turn-helix transcriptional regulator [Chelatococcus reniformis]|uniref:LuxR family transcriptional regulator n=1 Tax=Chelatococcus reniformis TaxID=1494448 RepID=A0A916U045_9HYPH|nr:helix-turn-helix transcriptional regulator [Chelatococcus reniformis]GGC55209.1 LuxR family transcriptional regulator [Chelatococcus reniformis]
MDDAAEQLIDRAYEASIVPDRWPQLLHDLAVFMGGAGGAMFTIGSAGMAWTVSESFREVMEIISRSHTDNARLRSALALRHPGFVSDADLLTREEMSRSPFYRDLLRPRGWGWVAGTVIDIPNGDILAFSLERRLERGPVESRYIAALDGLRPHLARAALLTARLNRERVLAGIEILAQLGLPAVVLDASGKALAANGLLEQIPRQIRIGSFDRLSLGHAKGDELLQSALAEIRAGTGHRAVRSIGIPAIDESPALVVHLVPIRGAGQDLFTFGAAVLVATPVTVPAAPGSNLLSGLFDLTPAEAKLARALVGGHNLTSAAQAQGVSRETLKTHLEAVLAKTGTRRQAELVGLLAGIGATRPQTSDL